MKKNINELKPHPRNQEFFDDIEGEKWEEFLESIDKNGVIEPLIITQDDVIVSGHQRVRALREIGKRETVNCIVKEYDDEDSVIVDLLEANMRRRGDVGGSDQKIGRRIKELERIYGVRQGKAGASPKVVTHMGQPEIAEHMGISMDQYKRYKKLADMIPEVSDALDAGTITQATALAMMKQLSEDEQLELISDLDATKKYTERETADLIEEIEELRNRPADAKEPADYQQIKSDLAKANKTVTGLKKDYQRLRNDLESRVAERNELRAKLKGIEDADSGNVKKKHQIDTGAMFSVRVNQFIEDVAGYIWLTDEVMELPESDRIKFIRSVKKIQDWANQMETNIRLKTEAE